MSSELSKLTNFPPCFSTVNDLMYGVVGGVSSKLTPKGVRGEYHLTDFGVVPNSNTDQTNIINSALDDIGPNVKVFIPPGNYNISGLILPHDNVEFYGVKNSSIFTIVTDHKTAITSTDTTGICIHDISMYGKGTGLQQEGDWGTGIILHGCSKSTIYNNHIYDFSRWLGGNAGVGGVWLRESCKDTVVSNNYVANCNNGINEDAYLASSVEAGPNRNVFSNNVLVNNRCHIVIENNVTNDYLTGYCNASLVINNYIDGHYDINTNYSDTFYSGINIASVQDGVCIGNRISNCCYGIGIWYSDQIAIMANMITESKIQGIQILDTVSGNQYPAYAPNNKSTDISIYNNHLTGSRTAFTPTISNTSLYPCLESTKAGIWIKSPNSDVSIDSCNIINPIVGQGFSYGVHKVSGNLSKGFVKYKNMVTANEYGLA